MKHRFFCILLLLSMVPLAAAQVVAGAGTGGAVRLGYADDGFVEMDNFGLPFFNLGTGEIVACGRFMNDRIGVIVLRNGRYVLMQTSAGTVQEITTMRRQQPGFTKSVGFGDMDSDGDNEFLVSNPTTGEVLCYEIEYDDGTPQGFYSLGVVTGDIFETVCAVADVDMDRDYDLVLQSSATNVVRYAYFHSGALVHYSGPLSHTPGCPVVAAALVSDPMGEFILVLYLKGLNGTYRCWNMSGTTRQSNRALVGWNSTFTFAIGPS